jgi:hypothetical protein
MNTKIGHIIVSTELLRQLLLFPDGIKIIDAYTDSVNGNLYLIIKGDLPDNPEHKYLYASYKTYPSGVTEFRGFEIADY